MCDGDDAESGATCNYLHYELYIFFNTLYKMAPLTRLQSLQGAVGLSEATVVSTGKALDTGLLLLADSF